MKDFQVWLNQLVGKLELKKVLVLDDKNQSFLMFDENYVLRENFEKN